MQQLVCMEASSPAQRSPLGTLVQVLLGLSLPILKSNLDHFVHTEHNLIF